MRILSVLRNCILQLRNTDNIRTDLYILLKPQSELGYLGYEQEGSKTLPNPVIVLVQFFMCKKIKKGGQPSKGFKK